MWKRTVGGRVLHFRLAGINNQNFLMRDDETGSWWQQASGEAIYGALKGQSLELAPYDELTFGLWQAENSAGQVLAPAPKYASHCESDWEPKVQKVPVVISSPRAPLQPRDVIIGLEVTGASRAYPLATLLAQAPIQDRLGGTPIVLVVGPDGQSVRAFVSRVDGADVEFFRKTGSGPWMLTDSTYGSEWTFRGCASAGSAAGKCLRQIPVLKDYWFDWRNYHPQTTIYHH